MLLRILKGLHEVWDFTIWIESILTFLYFTLILSLLLSFAFRLPLCRHVMPMGIPLRIPWTVVRALSWTGTFSNTLLLVWIVPRSQNCWAWLWNISLRLPIWRKRAAMANTHVRWVSFKGVLDSGVVMHFGVVFWRAWVTLPPVLRRDMRPVAPLETSIRVIHAPMSRLLC